MRLDRRHKYGARRTVVDGHSFPSAKEARRYGDLKLLERTGLISDLTLQPRFKLVVADELICTYVADFSYVIENGERVVEDSKGVQTDVFKLKRKLMRACLGIEVLIT